MDKLPKILKQVSGLILIFLLACGDSGTDPFFEDTPVRQKLVISPTFELTEEDNTGLGQQLSIEHIALNLEEIRLLGADPRIPSGGLELLNQPQIITADHQTPFAIELELPSADLLDRDAALFVRVGPSVHLDGAAVEISAKLDRSPETLPIPEEATYPSDKQRSDSTSSTITRSKSNSQTADFMGNPGTGPNSSPKGPYIRGAMLPVQGQQISSLMLTLQDDQVIDLMLSISPNRDINAKLLIPSERWFNSTTIQQLHGPLSQLHPLWADSDNIWLFDLKSRTKAAETNYQLKLKN